jgi:hypothetical protein
VPSAFLVNAIILFAGVAAFVLAGCLGTFLSRVQPWRFRILMMPLGFVVAGGIGISAEAHLLRWWNGGVSPHGLWPGIFQSIVLLITGSAGALAGMGLGFSLDLHLPIPPMRNRSLARYWERIPSGAPVSAEKVVPISVGRRQPGVVPHIRAQSGKD